MKFFSKHWDYCLLWIILDVICIVMGAPIWTFIILGICVCVLVCLREAEVFDYREKK
jgi:hypothetical protein